MPTTLLRILVACVFVSAGAAAQTFVFHLRGDQEVPPVPSVATGGCMATLNQPAFQLDVTCTHDVAGATIMHIHRGAPGVNGPVVFDLGNPASPVIVTWTGMTPADIADLLAGNFYVNIHTAGRPAGEIRGQMLTRTVDMVAFNADGTQVVPPGSTTATANCTADLDNPATSLTIQCTHTLASPTDAHVHEGSFGANGPIAFTFASAASPINENMPMTPQLVADFAGTLLYLDIHRDTGNEATSDQIRGQIGTPPLAATTGTIRIVKATLPAGGTNFGFTDDVPSSGGSFTLNDGGTHTFSSVAPGTYAIAENDPTASGYTLTDITCDDIDSTTNPFSRVATVRLQAGELVTCTFRNLQTIPTAQNFVFHLSGDQEAPPVPSTARGGCMAQFDAANSQMSIICTHNVIGATIMHIHRGAPGVNGPIAFDLGIPSSPVQATWTGMTLADIAELLAGNLYVNIHASGRPAGEIRGQILPRTIDHFSFFPSAAQEVPPTQSLASAHCNADLSDNAAALLVNCEHNVSGATMAHIHDAPAGTDGPIVINLPATNPIAFNAQMNPRLVADFAAGFLYVNIHSADFPEGEIRGQLIAQPDPSDVPALHEGLAIALAAMLIGLAWWRLRM